MKLFITSLCSLMILFLCSNFVSAQTQTAETFNVVNGDGNGVSFPNAYWTTFGNSDSYKYGPVSSHSLKNSIGNPNILLATEFEAGSGWTWGGKDQTSTALDISGNFQTEGFIKSMDQTYYFGDDQKLIGNNEINLDYYSNHGGQASIRLLDRDGDLFGRLMGTVSGLHFGLTDGDGHWSYLAAKDNYTAFRIDNDEKMRIKNNGNVGIGTTNPQHKLDVCGKIRGTEVIVENGWCDYVFKKNYNLKSIEDQMKFVKENGYLLNFESESEMAGEINIGDVTKRQQKTIEEQMLYIGQLNEENKELNQKYDDLLKIVLELQSEIQK